MDSPSSDITRALGLLRRAAFAACGAAGIATRLEAAHALMAEVELRDLPAALMVRFDELRSDLAYGGETVAQALALMNAHDQARLSERIVAFHAELCRHLPPEE